MIGDFRLLDHLEIDHIDAIIGQQVIRKAALLGIMRCSGIGKSPRCHKVSQPQPGERPKCRTAGQDIEIAADNKALILPPQPPDQSDKRFRLGLPRGRIAFSRCIPQSMHMGDGDCKSCFIVENTKTVGVSRPRMVAPAIGRK